MKFNTIVYRRQTDILNRNNKNGLFENKFKSPRYQLKSSILWSRAFWWGKRNEIFNPLWWWNFFHYICVWLNYYVYDKLVYKIIIKCVEPFLNVWNTQGQKNFSRLTGNECSTKKIFCSVFSKNKIIWFSYQRNLFAKHWKTCLLLNRAYLSSDACKTHHTI